MSYGLTSERRLGNRIRCDTPGAGVLRICNALILTHALLMELRSQLGDLLVIVCKKVGGEHLDATTFNVFKNVLIRSPRINSISEKSIIPFLKSQVQHDTDWKTGS